jgi:hypothetical protein
VSGMTDRFALSLHAGLFPDSPTPLLSSDR